MLTAMTELPLPPGWEKRMSKTFNREYYYHVPTETTTWKRPSITSSLLNNAGKCNQGNSKQGTNENKNDVSKVFVKKDVFMNSTSVVKKIGVKRSGISKNDEQKTFHKKKLMIHSWAADVNKNISVDQKMMMMQKKKTPNNSKPQTLHSKLKIPELKSMPLKLIKSKIKREEMAEEIRKKSLTPAMKAVLNKKRDVECVSNVAAKSPVEITSTRLLKSNRHSLSKVRLKAYARDTVTLKDKSDFSSSSVSKIGEMNIERKRFNLLSPAIERKKTEQSPKLSLQKNSFNQKSFLANKSLNEFKISAKSRSGTQQVDGTQQVNGTQQVDGTQQAGCTQQIGGTLQNVNRNKQLQQPNTVVRMDCQWTIDPTLKTNDTAVVQPHTVQPQYEETDMDVDDAVEMSHDIMNEIRGIRSEQTITKPIIIETEQRNEQVVGTYTGQLYIVVDTNVLLSHLKFISELKDYPLPGVGMLPILVVPWMVLKELDSLKNSINRKLTMVSKNDTEENWDKLNVLARQAIRFVNSCLQSDHPRLRGQTVMEANTPIHGFTEENNDDSIIHCALSLKLKVHHGYVVMLSNDINLCNKSLVLGIKAFSQKDLLTGIENLLPISLDSVKVVEVRKETVKENQTQELQMNSKQKVDQLFIELQCVLKKAFSKIIQDEMQCAYGESLWLEIVKIKPPWTLHDLFSLLDSHWIAVFGLVVDRKNSSSLKELNRLVFSNEGQLKQLSAVKKMIDLTGILFNTFAKVSSYDNVLSQCVTSCDELKVKCDEILCAVDVVPPTLSENQPAGELEQDPTNWQSPGSKTHARILEVFHTICDTVKSYSALIFYSLNFPSPPIKELDPNTAKPTEQEALSCLSTMTPCLLKLIKTIHNVTHIPVDCLSTSKEAILNVVGSVCEFSMEVLKRECFLQPEELLLFCTDQQTRLVLMEGLSQLDYSYALLQQCIDFYRS